MKSIQWRIKACPAWSAGCALPAIISCTGRRWSVNSFGADLPRIMLAGLLLPAGPQELFAAFHQVLLTERPDTAARRMPERDRSERGVLSRDLQPSNSEGPRGGESPFREPSSAGPIHLVVVSLLHRSRSRTGSTLRRIRPCQPTRKRSLRAATEVAREVGGVAQSCSGNVAECPAYVDQDAIALVVNRSLAVLPTLVT